MKIEEQLQGLEQNTAQFIIGNYLFEKMKNDPELEKKFDENNRSIAECYSYIVEKARQKAVNNSCCMTSEEVFGLAVHYALDGVEEGINVCALRPKANVTTTPSQPKPKSKKEKKPSEPLGEQLALF